MANKNKLFELYTSFLPLTSFKSLKMVYKYYAFTLKVSEKFEFGSNSLLCAPKSHFFKGSSNTDVAVEGMGGNLNADIRCWGEAQCAST